MYNKHLLQLENESFSLVVFTLNSVMRLEGNAVFSRIAELI